MEIIIYSDESGVFDKDHNDIFVFSGLVFTKKEDMISCAKKYTAAENVIRYSEHISLNKEIKASTISNKAKGKLFRALNQYEKFGVVINQRDLCDEIFTSKKTKQRYLDRVFNFAVRAKFEELEKKRKINTDEVDRLVFYIDNHSATKDSQYEFSEALEEVFQLGTVSYETAYYRLPVFPKLRTIEVKYCDSKQVLLVRAADIVSNKLFHMAEENNYLPLRDRNFYVVNRP